MKKIKILSYLLMMAFITMISINLQSVLIFLDNLRILDKTGHFIGFFLLSWVVHKIIKVDLFITVSTLILYAGLTEIGQYFLSFRSGQFSDFVADTIGCLFYLSFVLISRRLK